MILKPLLLTIVTPYLLLTAGLGAGIYLLFTLKDEIARLGTECADNVSRLREALRASEAERADLRRDFERIASRTEASDSIRPVDASFPRDTILRLHEQGESPAAIAQTLGLPDGQVKLLLKVRCLVGETS